MNLWGRSVAGMGEGTGAGERHTFATGEKPQVRIRMGEGASQKRRRLTRLLSVTAFAWEGNNWRSTEPFIPAWRPPASSRHAEQVRQGVMNTWKETSPNSNKQNLQKHPLKVSHQETGRPKWDKAQKETRGTKGLSHVRGIENNQYVSPIEFQSQEITLRVTSNWSELCPTMFWLPKLTRQTVWGSDGRGPCHPSLYTQNEVMLCTRWCPENWLIAFGDSTPQVPIECPALWCCCINTNPTSVNHCPIAQINHCRGDKANKIPALMNLTI